ncbi:MAG TPA: hypothetical protein VMM13_00885, partial [Euzebya sp.]|nr:hypothetical protein [Euzebya sp.]
MSEPTTPEYGEYLLRLITQIEASPGEAPDSPFSGAPEDVIQQAEQVATALTSDLLRLSHDIHAHPELGFEEHHAAATVTGFVRDHGHDASSGAFGLPTAVHARAGEGRPRVAFLAEYDALPGIGHACGH